MTLQVYTSPCVLTIVSFRLFGEFRLVHVFLSFGHGEGCVVVSAAAGAAAGERRRFIVGLQHLCGHSPEDGYWSRFDGGRRARDRWRDDDGERRKRVCDITLPLR